MNTYGLIGKSLGHSFSKSYFERKFEQLNIQDCFYQNFELETIDQLNEVIEQQPNLKGLNVTIPYKEAVLPFLDSIDSAATEIGAVNCVSIQRTPNKIQLIGHNTDYYGFQTSLKPLLNSDTTYSALILGAGGASKAVQYALKQLAIPFKVVGRTKGDFLFSDLTGAIVSDAKLLINCTPLGTYPNANETPPIPINTLDKRHIVYDLVYNPSKTRMLQIAEQKGATIKNGIEMLELQAEKSWEIWNR